MFGKKKAKREVDGNSTKNARIKIEYSGKKKPKVTFSYPDKKNQGSGSMFPVIFAYWNILCISIGTILFIGMVLGNLNVISIAEQKQSVNQSESNTPFPFNDVSTFQTILIFGGMLSFVFGIPCIIYFPFRKKWQSIFPDYIAWRAEKKYKKFKQEDVKEINGEIFVEIPVFENVICDFNAKKDFSKYLTEFEIREHSFKYLSGRKRKQINDFLWYARWYFKKKPINGELGVVFK